MAVEPTGSDYICDALEAEGVSTVFGLIGEGNAHLLDRMGEASPPFVQARHEQAAVSMADGYARASGSVGVCTVTHGPGVTNAVTGLACADRDGVGLVVLVGDTAIEGRETSLQYLDHLTVTSPVSGYGIKILADFRPTVCERVEGVSGSLVTGVASGFSRPSVPSSEPRLAARFQTKVTKYNIYYI